MDRRCPLCVQPPLPGKLYLELRPAERQVVGFGDDMWALGLLMAKKVTGRDTIKRMHGGRLVHLSNGPELQLAIAAEVADALGDSSQLFLLFACLLHREPALRLTTRQM